MSIFPVFYFGFRFESTSFNVQIQTLTFPLPGLWSKFHVSPIINTTIMFISTNSLLFGFAHSQT